MKLKKIISVFMSAAIAVGAAVLPSKTIDTAEAATAKARVSVHDPSVFKDPKSGMYYIFGSHIDSAKSKDLQNWTRFTNGYATTNNVHFGNLSQNLSKAFAWAGENLEDCDGGFSVWAPDVVWNPDYVNKNGSKGAYLMYFCTTSTYKRSVICYAASQTPEGPYEFVDTLIYSGFWNKDSWVQSKDGKKKVNRIYTSTNIDELIAAGQVTMNNGWFSSNGDFNNQMYPNAIDPTIYYSPDGRMYMTYGSWSGGIFTIEMDKQTGKCIHPKSGKTSDGRMVDSYFGTKISGGYGKSGEGPFIEYNPDNGYYYLWVTYGGLVSTGGYNMRVFRSKNPLGPFTDPAGNAAVLASNSNLDSIGLKVMGNYKFSSLDKAYMAPGHNSVLRDDNGRWYLLNHTRFDDGFEFHEVRVHSMYFNSEGWPVEAPYEYSGDVMAPGGYEESDIVGDYEFINHGLATNGNIINYVNIKLNADGTISGGATGTWKQAGDSSAATIKIGNQTYSGFFTAVQDEKQGVNRRVMTFTAVGSDNKTIWGVKTVAFNGKERPSSGAAASFANGSTWRFKNVNSGLYMQVEGAKAENNANVQQSEASDGNNDIWKLIDAGDGYYYIASALGDGGTYMLDISGKSKENGANAALYTYKGGDNQKFKFTKNSDNSYKIRTKLTNGSSGVEVTLSSNESGANVQQWEINGANCQDWILESVANPGCAMDTSVNYVFKNLNSGMVMDIADGKMEAGNDVRQWEANGADCQKWTLKEFAQGGNYYYIHSVSDPDYVLIANGNKDGGNVNIAKYVNNDSNMLFKFAKNPDGTYYIMTRNSKDARLVEVASASTEMGGNIQQWQPTNHDCQKWTAETYVTTTVTTTTTESTSATTEDTAATTVSTAPTTSDSTTSTNTTTVPNAEIGDINADGKVDTADVVMLKKWLVNDGDIINSKAADVNDDKIINVFDLIILKRRIIKNL